MKREQIGVAFKSNRYSCRNSWKSDQEKKQRTNTKNKAKKIKSNGEKSNIAIKLLEKWTNLF